MGHCILTQVLRGAIRVVPMREVNPGRIAIYAALLTAASLSTANPLPPIPAPLNRDLRLPNPEIKTDLSPVLSPLALTVKTVVKSSHPKVEGAQFQKVARCLYRHGASAIYYGWMKRTGKQCRRSLKTTDRKLVERLADPVNRTVGSGLERKGFQ